MMKKAFYTISKCCQYSLLLLLITPTLLWAEDDKIRFVNVPEIMKESLQAQAAKNRLEKEFSSQKKELDECDEDLDILDGKLRRQGREMEKGKRERMLDTIRQKQRECKELSNKIGAAYNARRSEELEKLNKVIYSVIEKIAKEKNIGLIVGPPIIYTNDQVDLTDVVLEELSRIK